MQLSLSTLEKPIDSTAEKAQEIHAVLADEYGAPIPYFSHKDPLSELISALLSHRTRNRDSGRAYENLRAQFPSWEAVRDAPTADVEQAIAGVRWPEQKAPRIQHALRYISEERNGLLALDFLAEVEVKEAQAWLEAIPGVGPKTSAATLLFSQLRMPALPVDSHHQRVAERVGLIPKKLSNERVHQQLAGQLPPDWNAQQIYDNHEVMMFHGQRVCHYRNPECERCVIRTMCDYVSDSKSES